MGNTALSKSLFEIAKHETNWRLSICDQFANYLCSETYSLSKHFNSKFTMQLVQQIACPTYIQPSGHIIAT